MRKFARAKHGGALNAIAGFLSTRRGLTLAAWSLLIVGMLLPASWGVSGGSGYSSSVAIYSLANLMKPEALPPSPYASLPRSFVFGLAFCTNLVFLFGIWFRDNAAPSRAFRAVLIGAVVIDVAAAFVLRDLARMAGYWLWVAGVAAIMWAFIARPAKGEPAPAPAKARKEAARAPVATATGLPDIVWVWIGWVVFWTAITLLTPWVKTETAQGAAGAAPNGAKEAALTGYVNDFAGALRPGTMESLSAALAQFEKETSTQVAVAVYPRLPEVPVEEFTIHVAEKSRLGRKGLDNGAILSIFAKDNVARVEVGYGLEGALTDVQVHRILEGILAPSWKRGDRDKAVEDTVAAVTAAVREEYRGGRMPGRLAVFWRQLTVEVPRFVKAFLPTLVELPTDARFGIAFFGSFFIVGFWDGFMQTRVLVRDGAIAMRNLRAGRPLSTGTQSVRGSSILDSMKVLLFLGGVAYALVGIVVIAGGGAFGSGGSTLHW
jgi:uncharacterized membrane protein YgcG